jgi:CheY-like chemotaxis protein
MKSRKKALIIDDEPEHLQWILDYFESQEIDSQTATNLKSAIVLLEKNEFDLILLDMNIPSEGVPANIMANTDSKKYAGLAMAGFLSKQGYRPHEVIGYTVHDDDAIENELRKFNYRYVLKGRPETFISVISKSFARETKDIGSEKFVRKWKKKQKRKKKS